VIATLGAIFAVFLSLGTYNYNRASFAVPLVSMLGVSLAFRRRVESGTLIAIALILAPLMLVFGRYRQSHFTIVELVTESDVQARVMRGSSLGEQIQLYGGAPQFLGYLLEGCEWGREPLLGQSLVCSCMSPVPGLGKSFREGTGTAIYNRMVYGSAPVMDQIAPFQGELFMNFWLFGVAAGFAAVGLAIARLERSFEASGSGIERYCALYVGIWIAFLVYGSLLALSQIVLFFFWPIICFRPLCRMFAPAVTTDAPAELVEVA
jgi:hypothetical protein